MSDNCCNLQMSVDEAPRLAMQISGANYYGPYELPTMSEDTKGGAILGSGLEVVSDTLSIDLTDEATGESVTAADASYLASLTVDGKAVQDGTPTPSNPVAIEVVQSINLYNPTTRTDGHWINDSGVINSAPNTSYSDKIAVTIGDSYTFSVTPVGDAFKRVVAYKSDNTFNGLLAKLNQPAGVRQSGTFTIPDNTAYIRISINTNDVEPQVEKDQTATPYIPYGSIGLKVGSTITPINLNGNVLASLPDGTKDVLTVDSVGHCVLEKRVRVTNLETVNGIQFGWSAVPNAFYGHNYSLTHGISGFVTKACYCEQMTNQYTPSNLAANQASGKYAFAVGNDRYFYFNIPNVTTAAQATSWLSENKPKIYIPYGTAETIDLGYIDMPAIPDGAEISITAQVTPTISASWWARGAAAIAEALKAVRARINAIEAAIAELATA